MSSKSAFSAFSKRDLPSLGQADEQLVDILPEEEEKEENKDLSFYDENEALLG